MKTLSESRRNWRIPMNKNIGQWVGTWDNICHYWTVYGGWKALLYSPYCLLSIALTVLLCPAWTHSEGAWSDMAMEILPSVIGFAVGAYTIMLAFGGEQFMTTIAGSVDNEPSPFMIANAAFVHFVVVNFIALLFSVFVHVWSMKCPVVNAIGVFLFVYALSLSLAATFAVLTLARSFDDVAPNLKRKK